ncbi:MAG: ferrochelatase [Alphaproteobacteria bacterium]|nr:ferrochelatase [Alphaproteobacteria bacterium]
MKKNTAVVLFNMGGPDKLSAVRPFLFNLFNEKAIIGAPAPIRWCLAQYISRKRETHAQDIYRQIGGRSPLLEQTNRQAKALEKQLGDDHRCFVAMRYWHPFIEETVKEVEAFAPDRLVLLPLYPQYSSTTTGSSFAGWEKLAGNLPVPARICCYPELSGLIEAFAEGLHTALVEAARFGPPRVLFSAHGLPKFLIDRGDPYQHQVERTAKAILERLGEKVDSRISYQSRVGPMEWIGPETSDEIRLAGEKHLPVIVVPLAFVSEHSETLVELDIEYKKLAEESGVPCYLRVSTPIDHPAFIKSLAELVEHAQPGTKPGGKPCQGANLTCPGVLK